MSVNFGSKPTGTLDLTGLDSLTLAAASVNNAAVNATAEIARTKLALQSLEPFAIPWTWWRIWNAYATNLPGTAAADDLALIGNTFGTAPPVIQSADQASNGTPTAAYARAMVLLPPSYSADDDVRFRFHSRMETVSDTTATIDLVAYESDTEEGLSADLVTTAATSMNSDTWADYDFILTDTNLAPGDILDIRLNITIEDGATGSGVIAVVGAAWLLCDCRP